MFDLALALAGRVDQFDSPLDWVADLRGRLPWGDFLGEDIFIELFLGLCGSRQDWHANPREPFNVSRLCYTLHIHFIRLSSLKLWSMLTMRIHAYQTEEHGPLAHAIDAFYSVVSGDWLGADGELFQAALPRVVESAREVTDRPRRVGFDPAATAPHTLGTGASSAAGEPHPQTHTALGGVQEEEENEDDDEDIEMDEGEEVEEVRQRLARTELGEDEDVEMED